MVPIDYAVQTLQHELHRWRLAFREATRYEGTIADDEAFSETPGMSKRIAASALWFYAGWTLGGLLAFSVGTPEIAGPLIGLAVALLTWMKPSRLFSRAPARGRWTSA